MATLRKHQNKWQSIVRVQGHPTLCKSFVSRTDAKQTNASRMVAGIGIEPLTSGLWAYLLI